ncbi:hypothetical protein J7K27_02465 [Candidatus Bathyarchaeota archaeon]|nr:hypothetical protein [Candidatus Bathyarchaeota archaeon]
MLVRRRRLFEEEHGELEGISMLDDRFGVNVRFRGLFGLWVYPVVNLVLMLLDAFSVRLRQALEEYGYPSRRIVRLRLPRPSELVERFPRIGVRTMPVVTRVIDEENYPVSYFLNLIDVNKRGRIRELVIKSPHPDFSISVETDGYKTISRSFKDLQEISPSVETIDAFQDVDGKYVLRLGRISWRNHGRVVIRTDRETVFDKIYAVYDIYED